MAINNLNDNKSSTKYDELIDDSSDDAMMIFLKALHDKIDEGLVKTNEHITDNAKQTVTGFDNIAFSVDSKFRTLTITVTSGSTTKTANLSLR
jgi:type IV pilus biogenesis protein CpaD/CtpE